MPTVGKIDCDHLGSRGNRFGEKSWRYVCRSNNHHACSYPISDVVTDCHVHVTEKGEFRAESLRPSHTQLGFMLRSRGNSSKAATADLSPENELAPRHVAKQNKAK